MTLEATVWPGLLNVMEGLRGVVPLTVNPSFPDGQGGTMQYPNKPLAGYSSGEQASIPQTPWAWLVNDTGRRQPATGGQDKEATDHRVTIRLLSDYTNDPKNAELILIPLIEKVRQAFRVHIKMGAATVEFAMVDDWDWGYISVNGIWYRSIDLIVNIREKEVKPYAA